MTFPLTTFLVSTGVVAAAEFGDKTQLLALVLAARFRRPGPIILGILLATIANHLAAGWLGEWLGSRLHGPVLEWALGLSFLVAAVWVLIPDRLSGNEQDVARIGHGAFITTLLAFFLAEIGDKTQIATIALAARFEALVPVVAGTTLGMLIANVPVVLLGNSVARRIPLRPIRLIAAAIFLALGIRELV